MKILALVLFSGYVFGDLMRGSLISCNDGDTCRIKSNNKVLKVRLNGIDAPETGHPGSEDSRIFLVNLLTDKNLSLNCSKKSYDRDVCTIFIGETDIQKEMVKSGNAIDVPRFSNGKYRIDQEYAKKNKLGIWKLNDIKSPYCQRNKKNFICSSNSMFQP